MHSVSANQIADIFTLYDKVWYGIFIDKSQITILQIKYKNPIWANVHSTVKYNNEIYE